MKMKHVWVNGFGKNAKVIRELTKEEVKKMNKLQWLEPEKAIKKS